MATSKPVLRVAFPQGDPGQALRRFLPAGLASLLSHATLFGFVFLLMPATTAVGTPMEPAPEEMLVSADTGIIKARQKLKKAVEALRDKGITPPGVDPTHHRVRSAA